MNKMQIGKGKTWTLGRTLALFFLFLETLCRKFFHATDNMEKVHVIRI